MMHVQTDAKFDYLINRRKELGLSKAKMGELLDKSHQTITNYEDGYIANDPYVLEAKLDGIAKAYQVDKEKLKYEYNRFLSAKQDIEHARSIDLRKHFEAELKGVQNAEMLIVDRKELTKANPELKKLVQDSLQRQLSSVVKNIYDLMEAYEQGKQITTK